MKLFSRKLSDQALFTLYPKRLVLWRRVTFIHATKGGGPVLKEEGSWRTINGVAIKLRHSTLMFLFRRREMM